MRSLFIVCLALCFMHNSLAQSPATELYELVKKLAYDSTGYENVGDWAVGNAKKYPVTWKADRIEMSNDTSINFYRTGTARVAVNGKTYAQNGQPIKWTIMLKGPRMGYGSYSIITSPSTEIVPKSKIEDLFPNKKYMARLIKNCDKNPISGFYYYELKLPKKDIVYLKLSWITINGSTAIRIDGFDSWSRHSAKLECPK